jgi:predicted 3-demethylubiquinone-9 3-methyltransferase (glyoxalase superfamily)
MTGITPFIWYDDQAEEAVNFYVSIFPHSRILKTVRYGDAGPGPKGQIMTIAFELDGREFTALNGGPHFTPSPAFSLVVHCENQQEIDRYWQKLSADPAAEQCGWVKDKYGLSWQIIPNILIEMIGDKDPEKAKRVTEAMLQMKKIDLVELKHANAGEHVRA